MAKINDLERWRVEIELAEKFRKDRFGEYSEKEHRISGRNIDYFERGFTYLYNAATTINEQEMITTLNLIHSVVKIMMPSIVFQNPKILATPEKMDSQETAPVVTNTLNYYYERSKVSKTNDSVAWDAYVLGHGYSKTGYATKFGIDLPDAKKKPKSVIDKTLEAVGLKEPKEDEVTHPEMNYSIVSENPYVDYVSPFNFLRDYRVNTMEESMWVCQEFRKSVKQMKKNKKYKSTSNLTGSEPDVSRRDMSAMSQSEIEDFRFVDLYEIHYRNDDEIYLLIISKDNEIWRAHYHEKSAYKLSGWQFEELTFNKTRHNSFAVSDITKISNLQDRFTSTLEGILEQVDSFVPKIGYNENAVTPEGINNLKNGDIGALVPCTKDPRESLHELNLTQLKADLKVLLENFIDLVAMQTGLTKAQIMGVATGETATSEQIAQGGFNARVSALNKTFDEYAQSQAEKLWQVVKQFVELTDLELINGQNGIDEQGRPLYNWLTVDGETSEKMQVGQYNISIEVGSTQKSDLPTVRKQFENMFSILARTDVITIMQQQGDKVVLSELLKPYLQLFPDVVNSVGRVIQKITPETTGLIPPEEPGPGGTTNGSNFNALEAQANAGVPTLPTEIGAGV